MRARVCGRITLLQAHALSTCRFSSRLEPHRPAQLPFHLPCSSSQAAPSAHLHLSRPTADAQRINRSVVSHCGESPAELRHAAEGVSVPWLHVTCLDIEERRAFIVVHNYCAAAASRAPEHSPLPTYSPCHGSRRAGCEFATHCTSVPFSHSLQLVRLHHQTASCCAAKNCRMHWRWKFGRPIKPRSKASACAPVPRRPGCSRRR